MLAQLFLVACFAAGMVAACMVFIAYGPVPVRRKVTIVPRMTPRDVFADSPAARTIALPQAVAAAPQEAVTFKPHPGVAFALPVPPPPPPAPPPEPLVTPLVLRRPRGGPPPVLPRSRSARGTERRQRPSELEITQVRTLESRAFVVEDDTFLEDGR